MTRHSISRIRAFSTPVLLAILLLGFAILIDTYGDRALGRTGVEMLVRVVLVVSLWIFVGNSGVISFGHAGFMAIGALMSAWLTIRPTMKSVLLPGLPDWLASADWSPFYASLAAGCLAAVIALIIGAAILRLTGIAASIATFAFLAIIYTVYSSWGSVTGGTSSIVGLPRYLTLWNALAWAVVLLFVASLYASSASGLALRATREDEAAAAASGVDIYRHRLISFVVSAFFTGIGGALLGHMTGVISPASFYLDITFLTLAMLVVGGIATLTGAVYGTIVLSVVIELFVRLERGVTIGESSYSLPNGTQQIVIGIVMILILILRPQGLSKGRELSLPMALFPSTTKTKSSSTIKE